MALWLDLKGPVLADTVYRNGVLVGKDVTVTLPAVNFVTHDHKAMGTVTLPVPGQIEAMEMTITKIGVDLGLGRMIALKNETFEFRWAQDVVKADGTSSPEGCKAFVHGVPKGIPGIGLEPGTASENEISLAVNRYQLYVAGEEYFLIYPLKGTQRILGVDYAKNIMSML